MVGLYGVPVPSDAPTDPAESMYWEDWYEHDGFDAGRFSLGLVTHGGKDPAAFTTWVDGERVGLLFGVVTNREALGWSVADLFERLLADPASTLSTIHGPFCIAVVNGDAGRAILAADKLGSRPGYYTTDGPFGFASELKTLVPLLDHPTLDRQAVSDVLLLNFVWGDKTLVEGVCSVRPGHYVEFQDGERTTNEYWRFEYGSENGQPYVEELARRYRASIAEMADTIDGDVGVWLSGGLDSRCIAGVLKEHVDDFETYTYVRPLEHPKRIGQDDLDLAPEVAALLEVANAQVGLDPDRFAELLPRCVDLVDGMLGWTSLTNLAAVFQLPVDQLDVVLEGSGQSELMGEDMWSYHLDGTHYDDAVEPLLQRHGQMSVDDVADLFADPIDPVATLDDELAASPEFGFENVVLDTNNRSLFSNAQFLSNRLTRSQTGTRHPFANGDLLDHIGKLDRRSRMGTLPFTKGKIPTGYSPIKIRLVRELDGGLETVPYDHTNFPPTRSLHLHTAGFVTQQVVNRAFATPVTADWYRESEALRMTIDGLLDDASDRPMWDRTAVMQVKNALKTEEWGVMHTVAAITTVELWAQRHLDPAVDAEAPRRTADGTVRAVTGTGRRSGRSTRTE